MPFGDAVDRDQFLDELMHVSSNEWFAAGQSDFVDAERGYDADEPFDFLEAEKFCSIHELDIVSRHAIEATDVATIGHADSQVVMNPAKAVDEFVGHWKDRNVGVRIISRVS
jgi:hypothetical protein